MADIRGNAHGTTHHTRLQLISVVDVFCIYHLTLTTRNPYMQLVQNPNLILCALRANLPPLKPTNIARFCM